MKLRPRPDKEYDITIRRDHLETLLCAAKWVLAKREGKVPRRAKDCLGKIIESYRKERGRGSSR